MSEAEVLRLFTNYISGIRKFAMKGKAYISNNREEIARENWGLLRKMTMLYTLILIGAIVAFNSVSQWDNYNLYLIIAMSFQILFTSLVFVLRYDVAHRYYITQITIEIFGLLIAALIIATGIWAYRNVPGIFFPPVLICLAILYIYPFKWIMIRITILEILYVYLAYTFKTPEAFLMDLFASLAAYIIATIAAFAIYNLRIKDFNSKSELKKLSATDLLTGLSNKITTEYLCEGYISDFGKGENCTLLVMDIDNFKGINDTLGHQQGDEVLRQIGAILQRSFRGNDIVGRIGGDEFMILMKNTNDKAAVGKKANSVLKEVQSIYFDVTTEKITCSIGIATSENFISDFQEMFSRADRALYKAKSFGKNKAVFYSEDDEINEEVVELPYILIADDAEVSRAILKNIFKEEFNIIEAKDGKEAIDFAYKYAEQIKVVLLDIEMPKLDGYQVISMMKADDHLSAIPVYFITAYEIDTDRAKQLGAIDVVAKPFRADRIMKQVKDVI